MLNTPERFKLVQELKFNTSLNKIPLHGISFKPLIVIGWRFALCFSISTILLQISLLQHLRPFLILQNKHPVVTPKH